MCEVRTKVFSCLRGTGTKYDFIMSRTASLNVYYRSFQSQDATRPSIIYDYSTKELKNKNALNLKQYCLCCHVTLSNVF